MHIFQIHFVYIRYHIVCNYEKKASSITESSVDRVPPTIVLYLWLLFSASSVNTSFTAQLYVTLQHTTSCLMHSMASEVSDPVTPSCFLLFMTWPRDSMKNTRLTLSYWIFQKPSIRYLIADSFIKPITMAFVERLSAGSKTSCMTVHNRSWSTDVLVA